MIPLRTLLPAPLRALRWRLPWVRHSPAYAEAPLAALGRALRFTLAELGGGEITVRTPDGLVLATMPNNFSSFAMAVAGARDPLIWAFIRRRLGPGAVFVDAGANVGSYTLPAARLVGPAGRVVAFEAHPVTFGFLARNVAANGLANVTALNLDLGEAPGRIAMAFSPANPGETHVATAAETRTTEVEMVPLDAALEGQGVGAVDYLKIDVEGFELPVLRGAARTIAASPGIVIQTELQPRHAGRYGHRIEDIAGLLAGLGLAPHGAGAGGEIVRLEGALRGDVLWLRPPAT